MEEELLTLKLWRTDWLIKFTLDHLTIQNNNPLWLHNDFKINSIPSNWNFECLFSFLFQILIFWTQAIKNSKSVLKSIFHSHYPVGMYLKVCIYKTFAGNWMKFQQLIGSLGDTFPTTFKFNLSRVLTQGHRCNLINSTIFPAAYFFSQSDLFVL